MPNLPKPKPRHWIKKTPKHTRQVDNSKFYNSKQWRATRNYYIQMKPLCEKCDRDNLVKSAGVVDHIVPITMGGSPIDTKNLQSLCKKCHDCKSGRESAEKRNNTRVYVRKKNDEQGGD